MLVVLVVSERRASACPIMLSAKQGGHWYHFNAFGMAPRWVSNPRPPAPEANALQLVLSSSLGLIPSSVRRTVSDI